MQQDKREFPFSVVGAKARAGAPCCGWEQRCRADRGNDAHKWTFPGCHVLAQLPPPSGARLRVKKHTELPTQRLGVLMCTDDTSHSLVENVPNSSMRV